MVLSPATWRNWNANRGAYVLADQADTPGDDPAWSNSARAGHLSAAWTCHPVNDAYVRRFLDLADAHGVPVFWLLPPTHPELQARRERFGWDADYIGYLRRLQKSYPRLTVIDGRHAGTPRKRSSTSSTWAGPPPSIYTDSVGAVIRDGLASRDAWPPLGRAAPLLRGGGGRACVGLDDGGRP